MTETDESLHLIGALHTDGRQDNPSAVQMLALPLNKPAISTLAKTLNTLETLEDESLGVRQLNCDTTIAVALDRGDYLDEPDALDASSIVADRAYEGYPAFVRGLDYDDHGGTQRTEDIVLEVAGLDRFRLSAVPHNANYTVFTRRFDTEPGSRFDGAVESVTGQSFQQFRRENPAPIVRNETADYDVHFQGTVPADAVEGLHDEPIKNLDELLDTTSYFYGSDPEPTDNGEAFAFGTFVTVPGVRSKQQARAIAREMIQHDVEQKLPDQATVDVGETLEVGEETPGSAVSMGQ